MSADRRMRDLVAGIAPGITLPPARFHAPPPLSRARVAIVTTAGLTAPGEPWPDQSHDVRVVTDVTEVLLGHNSTNFDRSGFAADHNVVFPIDRLSELAASGAIGSVAPRHLSFLGSTLELSSFVLDTGPRAAQLLADDGVDVVLLTPV